MQQKISQKVIFFLLIKLICQGVRKLQESSNKYDLINGIKRNVENRDLRNNKSDNKLLEISRQKYELLTGASVIPKTSNKEEEYICKRQYIL